MFVCDVYVPPGPIPKENLKAVLEGGLQTRATGDVGEHPALLGPQTRCRYGG